MTTQAQAEAEAEAEYEYQSQLAAQESGPVDEASKPTYVQAADNVNEAMAAGVSPAMNAVRHPIDTVKHLYEMLTNYENRASNENPGGTPMDSLMRTAYSDESNKPAERVIADVGTGVAGTLAPETLPLVAPALNSMSDMVSKQRAGEPQDLLSTSKNALSTSLLTDAMIGGPAAAAKPLGGAAKLANNSVLRSLGNMLDTNEAAAAQQAVQDITNSFKPPPRLLRETGGSLPLDQAVGHLQKEGFWNSVPDQAAAISKVKSELPIAGATLGGITQKIEAVPSSMSVFGVDVQDQLLHKIGDIAHEFPSEEVQGLVDYGKNKLNALRAELLPDTSEVGPIRAKLNNVLAKIDDINMQKRPVNLPTNDKRAFFGMSDLNAERATLQAEANDLALQLKTLHVTDPEIPFSKLKELQERHDNGASMKWNKDNDMLSPEGQIDREFAQHFRELSEQKAATAAQDAGQPELLQNFLGIKQRYQALKKVSEAAKLFRSTQVKLPVKQPGVGFEMNRKAPFIHLDHSDPRNLYSRGHDVLSITDPGTAEPQQSILQSLYPSKPKPFGMIEATTDSVLASGDAFANELQKFIPQQDAPMVLPQISDALASQDETQIGTAMTSLMKTYPQSRVLFSDLTSIGNKRVATWDGKVFHADDRAIVQHAIDHSEASPIVKAKASSALNRDGTVKLQGIVK